MAKGKKTGGRDFVKGQIANPGGITKELALERKLTREGLTLLLNKARTMTHEQMMDALGKPDTPAFEMMILKCYMRIMEDGDMRQMDLLLDRLVGKVKDELEVNVKPFVIKRKDGSIVEMGARTGDDEDQDS